MIYRDQLEAVYALIEKPDAWTQRVYARDADGNEVAGDSVNRLFVDNPVVCSRCILGAGLQSGVSTEAMHATLSPIMWEKFKALCSTNDFNDDRTHAEVLSLLSSAIERAPVRP